MWGGDDPIKDVVPQNDNSNIVNNSINKKDAEMSDNVVPPRQERRNSGRGRSMSVPCRGAASNVDSVMTKAKRASSYLWMLLHSQNCRLGVDRCSHSGCANAKLTHLHLKTCPAGGDFPCPTNYAGCVQARKLLAHYRQCRNIRSRQVGHSPTLKGQHVCLICSMVARQARSVLDSNVSSCKSSNSQQGPVIAHKKSSGTTKCQVVSSFTVKAKLSPKATRGQRNILTSFTLSSDSGSAEFFSRNGEKKTGPGGEWGMPPPAPRPMVSTSAPASPVHEDNRQELKGKEGTLMPIPLFRKRSESLGNDTERRAVSFAPRPQFLEKRRDSLVAVEMASPNPAEDDATSTGRVRSASCHVITASNSGDTSCGTIYEEIGQGPGRMGA